ncbi:Crp/Fnr family transcriptional regulator [Aquimarina sp. U1-2]|uniref:Crp/Fnr family transcriptional regulator n=1 Tax=Aquimarina sp. U1-2 TaxID=2823141 RepID=UPI001AECC682|nr:Crp/Fnr family transcriptional regulator [Aquimarina sp. U1-2]MBP2831240.1 Crp/Fnr family transcriptional regulator [Aquimarina sp. U1-2]
MKKQSEYNKLETYLDSFSVLGNKATAEITSRFQVEKFKKKTLLIKQDDLCNELYFIIKGSCRYFHFKKRKEVTHWFGFEGSFFTSFQSFTTGDPSCEYIQLTEKSTLLKITKSDLHDLYEKYPEWQTLGRLIVENYARMLMERITCLQIFNATQKYIHLFKTEPRILQRMPIIYIASYLGIAPDTLSRIRSRIFQKPDKDQENST